MSLVPAAATKPCVEVLGRPGSTGAPLHRAVLGDAAEVLASMSDPGSPLSIDPVDLVLIDPPYNTGAVRTYRDRFEDWSGWMADLLTDARTLLAPAGIVAVFVGPDEMVSLRLAMDGVFGAGSHLSTITWVGRGSPAAQFGAGGLDHIVVYARHRPSLRGIRWREPHGPAAELVELARTVHAASGARAAEVAVATWKRRHTDIPAGLGPYRHVDDSGRLWRAGPLAKPTGSVPGQHYEVLHPGTGLACPVPGNGWRMTHAQMQAWDAAGQIVWASDHTRAPRRRIWLDTSEGVPPCEVFFHERHLATRRLDRMLCGHRFDNPKDVGVLARWIALMAPRDAVVLDFFAGSGSTGEAVMALNARDGGTRRAVLVTNDEVFESVLVPRMVAVCDGVRPDASPWPEAVAGARIEIVRDQDALPSPGHPAPASLGGTP